MSVATQVLDSLHRIAGSSFAKLCLCSSWCENDDLDNYGSLVDTICLPNVTVQIPSQCFLPACIMWWDGQMWRLQQALGTVLDPSQVTSQWRHTRTGTHHGWETVSKNIFGDQWKQKAASTDWVQMKGEIRDAAYKMFNMASLEERFRNRTPKKHPTGEPLRKRPRVTFREPMQWTTSPGVPRVEVLGDSLLIISWLNGLWRCRYRIHNARVRTGHSFIQQMFENASVRPREDTAE